jgi:sugar phosphate isomerase/epimerase
LRLSSPGAPHLTYCTNIHAGESLAEVRRNVEELVSRVKQSVSPSAPFGVGLRLSARAAEELDTADALASFRAMLAQNGLYVFTINGFPYGEFHTGRVKEAVYLPDWLAEARLDYTNRLASLLAQMLPDDPSLEGSVSTSPGAFKPNVKSEADVASMADRMIRHAVFLRELALRTGKTISLAIEPEPECYLETIEETVSFFEHHLFSRAAVSRATELLGVGAGEAEEALRRHLGVCFDICHMAVEFEDPEVAFARLERAGIRVGKVQISAGLELQGMSEALRAFDDGVYLHHVVHKGDRGLTRYLDLADAFGEGAGGAAKAPLDRGTLRVHFHVPLFRENLGPFSSTQPYVKRVLSILRERAISAHLEVETYTWGVLPEQFRNEGIVDAVGRELGWVIAEMSPR